MHVWFRQVVKWALLAAGAFVAGCAGLPKLDKVNEVYFCAAGAVRPGEPESHRRRGVERGASTAPSITMEKDFK